MHKSRAELITCGNMRDDFDSLADCDWIIEAVVERLDIKKDLYKRLDAVIKSDCVVTSNTSTIPISLLIEDMPESFCRRFAITHYFNPVRYMRLLELVRGETTDETVTARLADYNDRILGKGVVLCNDTPGFLGNRVGVYALQVGLDETMRQGLSIESADALMGRPMGIPKTGIFGLYDLIGIDLMSDVVDTLENILPQGDAFFDVGSSGPVAPLITKMITTGFTGDKGKGGFYRLGKGDIEEAIDLASGKPRPRQNKLPAMAEQAATSLSSGGEPLADLITDDDSPEGRFSRRVLARVLGYAAGLIPDVTCSPQDIDDVMKLGFNWLRGPFEMIDAIGVTKMRDLLTEAEMVVPPQLENDDLFYRAKDGVLQVRRETDGAGVYAPVSLPEGTVRFHMLKRCLEPMARNAAASLYTIGDNLRLVEFHSKANALTDESIEIVTTAVADHGRGIIIHNDAQHFSAGVDLNGVIALINAEDWSEIDAFLLRFQNAVKALSLTPVPVIAAPSGLTLGGGYEVVAHADKVIAHGNVVMGLVEAAVGLVPGGGGIRETFYRWHEATDDWRKAAWNTWMQIGYSRTGTSPETSASLTYFLEGRDKSIMNRDKLLTESMLAIEAMHKAGYQAPKEKQFTLPARDLLDEMSAFMDKGIADGLFFPHDKNVAMAVASVVVHDSDQAIPASEDDLYRREREAFIHLAKTAKTKERIKTMLEEGAPIRN
jgi:3-hydroxyacyl-CoA dehydrogenase